MKMTKTKNASAHNKRRPYFELIDVREVKPLDGFNAHFVFSDGTERDIDLDQYVRGGVFEPIRNDPDLFRNMFVENGTITWPGEVDIAPETLYYGDEDPPWVKYDKEQERKAKQRKRARRSQHARKSVNGSGNGIKSQTAKMKIAKSRSRKTAQPKKK
ncbi:MAG: DUF2442 domain-containing protein [Chloroflexota bacterium]|nr:MAG: DUF2442 domain-containing protein [Chloroflexota bacterium]